VLAAEMAENSIRVNSVHPTNVDTIMVQNETTWGLFDQASENPTQASATPGMTSVNLLPVPWVECIDVSNAVLFLASEESRYITGVLLPVDAGATL
jgi:NAD(P)-dependent dehydrogenase (short-subunit alcohol dehydrogenase family)